MHELFMVKNMIPFFYKRLLILKKKLERVKEQVYCPHEFEVILNHRDSHGEQRIDVFCPICEEKRENLKMWKWKHLQNERELREREAKKKERENVV